MPISNRIQKSYIYFYICAALIIEKLATWKHFYRYVIQSKFKYVYTLLWATIYEGLYTRICLLLFSSTRRGDKGKMKKKKNHSQINDKSSTSIWLNLNHTSAIELQSFRNYNHTTSDGGYLISHYYYSNSFFLSQLWLISEL